MSLDTDERAGSAVSGKGDEPIDGLDGTVRVAPGQLFGSIYAFFYNKRVGLVLILLPVAAINPRYFAHFGAPAG